MNDMVPQRPGCNEEAPDPKSSPRARSTQGAVSFNDQRLTRVVANRPGRPVTTNWFAAEKKRRKSAAGPLLALLLFLIAVGGALSYFGVVPISLPGLSRGGDSVTGVATIVTGGGNIQSGAGRSLPSADRATVTATLKVVATATANASSTSAPSATPFVDMTRPTVRCKDGAELTKAYQQGACGLHGGLDEMLQPIPERP